MSFGMAALIRSKSGARTIRGVSNAGDRTFGVIERLEEHAPESVLVANWKNLYWLRERHPQVKAGKGNWAIAIHFGATNRSGVPFGPMTTASHRRNL